MKILVADDHDLVREGLCSALGVLAETVDIIQAENVTQVRRVLAEHEDIELIVLDLFMPGGDGATLVVDICNQHPDIIVLVLSASEDAQDMQRVIDAGAAGYVPKSAGRDVLLNALRLVLAGGTYIPPELIYGTAKSSALPINEPGTVALSDAIDDLRDLTQRQKDVLKLTTEGKTNKEIARLLDISLNTVKVHMAAIFRILGVTNRTQAVAVIREMLVH